mmetsp:Transcript_22912/g.41386  ORF Transcript_22912/g.41386 Transcript_22912/m.41386 type:complete len:253 (-) Transcript_22912:339-1097(-)
MAGPGRCQKTGAGRCAQAQSGRQGAGGRKASQATNIRTQCGRGQSHGRERIGAKAAWKRRNIQARGHTNRTTPPATERNALLRNHDHQWSGTGTRSSHRNEHGNGKNIQRSGGRQKGRGQDASGHQTRSIRRHAHHHYWGYLCSCLGRFHSEIFRCHIWIHMGGRSLLRQGIGGVGGGGHSRRTPRCHYTLPQSRNQTHGSAQRHCQKTTERRNTWMHHRYMYGQNRYPYHQRNDSRISSSLGTTTRSGSGT